MNPLLMITNAGRGETPPCPEAKFKPNALAKHRRRVCAIVCVVPPGFPAEYAWADY